MVTCFNKFCKFVFARLVLVSADDAREGNVLGCSVIIMVVI